MEGSIESLLSADVGVLSRDARLDRLVALQRVAARVAAATERTLATMGRADDRKNYAREEVACSVRWSFGYTQARLAQAGKLVSELPGTLALQEAGELSADHVRAIVDRSFPLDAATSRKVEERVLGRAAGQTVTEFKASVTRAVHRVDPRGADERHTQARRTRGVFPTVLPDGMAAIWSVHDAVTVEAIMTRLREAARTPHGPGDDRTADERRADALAALLLGGASHGTGAGSGCGGGGAGSGCVGGCVGSGGCVGGVGGANPSTQQGRAITVHVVVPYEVLLGSDLSGELLGYGPIPAGLCRQAAASATVTFRRWIVGPLNDLIDCASTYVPNQGLKDFITARDRTCRMPGCTRTAVTCELDHRVDYDGTNTTAHNLHALYPRHHHLKTDTDWTVDRDPDGTTRWRTPTGRHFTKPPDPYPGPDQHPDPNRPNRVRSTPTRHPGDAGAEGRRLDSALTE